MKIYIPSKRDGFWIAGNILELSGAQKVCAPKTSALKWFEKNYEDWDVIYLIKKDEMPESEMIG